MSGPETVALNGREMWAYVVELDGGLRVQLDLTDWERLGLYRGQRVPVRRPARSDEWLFLAEVVELPPVAWVVLSGRVGARCAPTRPSPGAPATGR